MPPKPAITRRPNGPRESALSSPGGRAPSLRKEGSRCPSPPRPRALAPIFKAPRRSGRHRRTVQLLTNAKASLPGFNLQGRGFAARVRTTDEAIPSGRKEGGVLCAHAQRMDFLLWEAGEKGAKGAECACSL